MYLSLFFSFLFKRLLHNSYVSLSLLFLSSVHHRSLRHVSYLSSFFPSQVFLSSRPKSSSFHASAFSSFFPLQTSFNTFSRVYSFLFFVSQFKRQPITESGVLFLFFLSFQMFFNKLNQIYSSFSLVFEFFRALPITEAHPLLFSSDPRNTIRHHRRVHTSYSFSVASYP